MRRIGIFVVAASASRRCVLEKSLHSVLRRSVSVDVGPAFSLARMQQCGSDLLLADLQSSTEAASMLRFLSGTPTAMPAVALIDDPDPAWVRRALAADVNAILSRDAGPEDLRLGIQAADAGLVLLHPSSARLLVPSAAFPLEPELGYDGPERLTAREQEVLRLMSEGMGNKEIAAHLRISEHTVKFHASSILGKLGASSRTEAVSRGIRRGLVSL